MAEEKKFYICDVCGNQVELVHDGGGELVCCGQAMTLLDKSSEGAMNEKHELLVEEIPGGMRVSVGNPTRHVMTPAHFIQWIECWVGKHVFRKSLEPTDEPVVEFQIEEIAKAEGDKPRFRAYCNLHGIRYCPCCEK
ncbi:MAG: desulfoferrodoxin FeS4 iron-binding domain-containing protein [Planctomycetia bacterium]|nr:desulfoferrodoxin FeS4 iron-binding domain-containing protein [Planctomycetia bacterium]